jgi:hypothetical protein
MQMCDFKYVCISRVYNGHNILLVAYGLGRRGGGGGTPQLIRESNFSNVEMRHIS